MTQIITAIFENGLLKPNERLNLPPGSKVRLTVEPLDDSEEIMPKEWEEFEKLCDEISINSGGERMTRDQLHERH